MKKAIILLSAFFAASCATEAPVPVPSQALTDAEFQLLLNAADRQSKQSEAEAGFTALLDRADLTDTQRARVYLGRGTKRGIWVRDDPMAYPQCAVMDFREFDRLAPSDDPRRKNLDQNIDYQFSRFSHFDDAPGTCAQSASEYQLERSTRK